jgi:isopenicillin-N epimerase
MNPSPYLNYFKQHDNIILNAGSVSRLPQSVLEAEFNYMSEFESNPSRGLFLAWQRLWDIQKKLARFFGADPVDIFLRNNVTLAMNDFLLGVDLPAKGSIVISDLEYGAITNICQLRTERENRKLHVIKIKSGADSYSSREEITKDIIDQLPEDACLVMLSHIIAGSGLLLPIEEIGAALRKKNILFAVDGAHGPGSVILDFKKLQTVDFYGGNLHKWFMGPKGTAFGWAHKSVQQKMKPLLGSWTTAKTLDHFLVFGDGDPFALKMLMSHTNNFAAYYALSETIDFWLTLGEKNIHNQIYKLQDFALAKMSALFDWPLLSPKNAVIRGPLISFQPPIEIVAKGLSPVLDMWEKYKVQIMLSPFRDSRAFRLSPHIYNTENEIANGLEKFKLYLKSR